MTESVKTTIFKKSVALLAAYTCQRWSVLAPIIVYLTLFGIVKLASIPLRSGVEVGSPKLTQSLHENENEPKTFKLGDGELTEPHSLLETIFHK